nr:hypothetical protein [uncultured Solibaculum sp.]
MPDDNDIRIAGDHPSRETSEENVLDQTAQELEREKRNGNLERARQLGALVAGEMWASDSESLFGADASEGGQGLFERRLLYAFAASTGLERYTPNQLCARTALSSFYDILKKEAPDLYDQLENSFAFSFYYLDLRRGQKVPADIGKSFAMLCNREDDPVYAQLGEALYLRFLDVIKAQAGSLHFVVEPGGNQ